jgi:hypothetical protein
MEVPMREITIGFAIIVSLIAAKDWLYDQPREEARVAATEKAERIAEDERQEKCWAEDNRPCADERMPSAEQLQQNLEEVSEARDRAHGGEGH